MLNICNLSGGYGNIQVINDISFSVGKGEILGILGPNGSGKTTLMKMISGAIRPSSGEVLLLGKQIHEYTSKELAKKIAVLPQHSDSSFTYSVREIVALGRYPHQKGLLQFSTSKEDEEVITTSMKQTNVFQFKEKSYQTLSGGEKQRVLLARAVAQEPQILLLDEPTNHLDISYQMGLLDNLKEWSQLKGLTVIAILHDLNIASLYCDKILLLNNGETVGLNRPYQVLEEKRLKSTYRANLQRHNHPTFPRPLITFQPKELDKNVSLIENLTFFQSDEQIKITSQIPLKTLSSAVIGSGYGWFHTFINRHVDKNYYCDDPVVEYTTYLQEQEVNIEETVGMMTAAFLKDVCSKTFRTKDMTLKVVVTAGTSNAVDVTRAYLNEEVPVAIGTINTWIFIEGTLYDAAFVQGMVTATEAKVKAMQEEGIVDQVTGTIATGTSTDSILIAATQTGRTFPYAGPVTDIGKYIAKIVFEVTREAIKKNKIRRSL